MPRKWSVSAKKIFSKSNESISDSDSSSSRKRRSVKPKKHAKSSSESDDDSSSSGSFSSDCSESSKSSSGKSVDSSGAKIVKPIKLAAVPNFDDSSSGSSSESEFGCGTYRRREDLSVSSASSKSSSSSSASSNSSQYSSDSRNSSDESSVSSTSSDENGSVPSLPAKTNKYDHAAPRKSFSEPALNSAALKEIRKEKRKPGFGIFKKAVPKAFRKKTSGEKVGDVLVPNRLDRLNPSTSSMGSKKSAGSSLPSKRESSSEEDSDSGSDDSSQSSYESSSGESSVSSEASSAKKDTKTLKVKEETKPPVAVKAKPKPRRASSGGDEKRPVIETSKPRRRSTISSTNSDPEPKSALTPSLYDEDQVNMIRGRKSTVKTTASEVLERGEATKPAPKPEAVLKAKASWGLLKQAIKNQNEDVESDFSKMLLEAKKMKEKRRSSMSGGDSDLNDSASNLTGGDSDDVFMKVLQKAKEMKEEKLRQSLVANGGGEKTSAQQDSNTNEGGGSQFAKLANADIKSKAEDEPDKSRSGSDEEFQAPKLVHQRPSLRHLFDGEEEEDVSSESDGSEANSAPKDRQQNLSVEESDEESCSSNDQSEEEFLSTESSEDDEDVDTCEIMSSDDEEQSLSAESQMSILTPIAEESVLTPMEDTGDDLSSLDEIKSASDMRPGEEARDDQSEGEGVETNGELAPQLTGGEAMLTDMPDENDVALAKRKAVQAVMKDNSLSAIDRNKKIQDIMAGRVELPKLSPPKKQELPTEETVNVTNHATDSELTGGEGMWTDMPDENDVVLAKRKAVQDVMKDKNLSAVERNKKIQSIMAGRVDSQDPSIVPISSSRCVAESEAKTPKERNGKSKESPSRKGRRKSTKKPEVAKEEPSMSVSKDRKPSRMPANYNGHTSSSTMETFDSSVDEPTGEEQREADASHAISLQTSANDACSLLELDQQILPTSADNHRAMFQTSLSSAKSSENKTPDDKALLTAMTCALHDLDSRWNVHTYSTSVKSSSKCKSIHCTLEKRERISPWSKHLINSNIPQCKWESLLEEISPSIKRGPPKPSRELRKGANTNALDDSNVSSIEDSYRSQSDNIDPRIMAAERYRSINQSYRSLCESLDSNEVKAPQMPSKQLTQATFDLKKSAVIEKITHDLLLEPLSEDQESEDDEIVETLEHSLTKSEIKLQRWIKSIHNLDPRWQIRKFFDDASVSFDNAEIFSVWRPTSFDAIAKMMRGEGVGKGLDIKGKSARCGDLSGYVPFLQIHHNEHIPYVRVLKGDRTQIFFKSREARNAVGKVLGEKSKEMALRVTKAKFALTKLDESDAGKCIIDDEELDEEALITEIDRYEVTDSNLTRKDAYAPKCYGLEVSCRVLWEELVVNRDISREPGSKYDTGRASQPAFQEMNFATLRKQDPKKSIPVLYQYSDDDPFDPRMLIVAYEEEGRVVPVVSDFDCFLIGSRDFSFKDDMAQNQIDLLDWCVSQIEWILENQADVPESWTCKWLAILKHAAQNGFVPKMPPYGFGDPSSYALIEAAVIRSKKTNGAVRHGPECFNYFFPQDLDDELLVIFPGQQRWRYVNISELQTILIEKIREGFTVPLNPKWILCDPGWINVFIELLKSRRPSVQASMNMWFPRKSGLRERIIDISKRYPEGFHSAPFSDISMSLAVQEYERFLVLQRAKQKLRGFLVLQKLHRSCKERTANFEKQQRVINLTHVVSAKNVAKTLKRMSMVRIEKETVESIRDAVLFEEG